MEQTEILPTIHFKACLISYKRFVKTNPHSVPRCQHKFTAEVVEINQGQSDGAQAEYIR
jgi:hypothetical protein